jgi:hypothetical protein
MSRIRIGLIVSSFVAVLLVPAAPAAGATFTFSGTVSTSGTVSRTHTFGVTAPARIVGTLSWSGSADLDLFLNDAANVRRARSAGSRNPEVITFDADMSGTWKFRVTAASGSASYVLTVSVAAIPPPDPIEVGAAVEAGIAQDTRTWSANISDANGDGIADVFLVRHALAARLYLGDADGRFHETLAGTFRKRDRHDCDWADVNLDGRQDLYCSIGADHGTGVKANELWIQRTDGTFAASAGAWGVTDPYGRGRWVTFIDVNHDPYPDLFVGNHFPRKDGIGSPNRLFINDRGQRFVERVVPGLTREAGGYCARAADLNGDGWEDLIVCGDPKMLIYTNAGGTSFTDVTSSVGVSGFWRSAVAADLNGDARLDLAMLNRGRFQVQLQGSTGRFASPIGTRSLVAGRHVTAADWDGDGDIDLYVTQSTTSTSSSNVTSNAPDLLLRNDGTGTFTPVATIPTTTRGRGDAAEPLDRDGDGAAGFLVMNGEGNPGDIPETAGPIQLIEA